MCTRSLTIFRKHRLPYCKDKNVNSFEYAEQCTKSRKKKTRDQQTTYFTRCYRLHDDIERSMIECFNKIPNVSGLETNPKILDTFETNSDDPFIPRTQNQIIGEVPPNELSREQEPISGNDNSSLINPRDRFHRDKQFQYADIKLTCNFTDNGGDYLVDITVAGIHAKSNVKHTIKNGEYTSGLSDYGADKKDNKHKHYFHDNRAIGFAFDSHGDTYRNP